MGFQYKLGLNVLDGPFKVEGNESGLFACLLDDIPYWTNLTDDSEFVGRIDIPHGAKVVARKHKIKVDKLILSDVVPIQIFFKQWYHPYYVLHCDPFNLRFILPDDQTWYQGIMAVEGHPHAFAHLDKEHHEWTQYEIMLKANGNCLQYIPIQPEEACKLAVQQNGMVLGSIRKRKPEYCELAVKQNGLALQFVEDQTEELCLTAVKQNPMAIRYVKDQTFAIAWAVWNRDKRLRSYLRPDFVRVVEMKSRDLSKRLLEGCIQMK